MRPDAAGVQERLAAARKRVEHRVYGGPVHRRIVGRAEADHTIGCASGRRETIQVTEIAADRAHAGAEQPLARRIGPRQPFHLMPGSAQVLGDGGSDVPGRAGHKHTHRSLLHGICW